MPTARAPKGLPRNDTYPVRFVFTPSAPGDRRNLRCAVRTSRREPAGSDGGAASDHRHMRHRLLALLVVLAGLVAAVPSSVPAANATPPTAGVRVRGATLVDLAGRP